MLEKSDRFHKENEKEFRDEERIYQAECALEDTKVIMEGGRVRQDCI